MTTVTQLYEPI